MIVGGSSGTLGELAIAYDECKLIGILTGTGGISDVAKQILTACKKETGARVVYDTDPENLVRTMIELYRTEDYLKPSCFCDEGGPSAVARRQRATRSAETAKCNNCAK